MAIKPHLHTYHAYAYTQKRNPTIMYMPLRCYFTSEQFLQLFQAQICTEHRSTASTYGMDLIHWHASKITATQTVKKQS